jgi:hypothetical protein
MERLHGQVFDWNGERFGEVPKVPFYDPQHGEVKAKEGTIVALDNNGKLYQLNHRTTGYAGGDNQRFLKMDGIGSIKAKELPGVKEVRQEIVDLLEANKKEYQKQAYKYLKKQQNAGERPIDKAAEVVKAGVGTIKLGFKVAEKAADIFEGIISPALTPSQRLDARIAEEQKKIDNERDHGGRERER